ncbi:MAG: hypothetical protein KKD44_07485 [Proteobacteria bacterium]|nr:hypothetical protein [Pseudomonadota bacterium]
MFKFIKSKKNTPLSPLPKDHDQRKTDCRRISFDTKYIGLGKCMERRNSVRRKKDRFDQEEYDRICQERLGPGWL